MSPAFNSIRSSLPTGAPLENHCILNGMPLAPGPNRAPATILRSASACQPMPHVLAL